MILTLGNTAKMSSVRGVFILLRRQQKLFLGYPAVFVSNFLGRGYLNALTLLHHTNEVASVPKALNRSRIHPRKSTSENLNVEKLLFKIYLIERGYLKLSAL